MVQTSLGFNRGWNAPVEKFRDARELVAGLQEGVGFQITENIADPRVVFGISEAVKAFAKD